MAHNTDGLILTTLVSQLFPSLPTAKNAMALELAKADSVELLCLALDATQELDIAKNAMEQAPAGKRTKFALSANREKECSTKVAAAQ
jgi:hypothetical protein